MTNVEKPSFQTKLGFFFYADPRSDYLTLRNRRYQGERNAKNVPQALHYRKQLPQMIEYYCSSWHELSGGNTDRKFPVSFTQLPCWNPPQTKPVEGITASWAVSREMMRTNSRVKLRFSVMFPMC